MGQFEIPLRSERSLETNGSRALSKETELRQRTFSDRQIKEFLQLHLTKYPDAIERMHFVMKHPFRDNDEQMSRSTREILDTAQHLAFFHAHAQEMPKDRLVKVADPYYHARYDIESDVIAYVAAMLGPIGSYDVEE